MATVITDDLEDTATQLDGLLAGMQTLHAAPANQDKPEVLAELAEEIAYIGAKIAEARAALIAVGALVDGGYPDYRRARASPGVIRQLESVAAAAALASHDFEEPKKTADKLEVAVGQG